MAKKRLIWKLSDYNASGDTYVAEGCLFKIFYSKETMLFTVHWPNGLWADEIEAVLFSSAKVKARQLMKVQDSFSRKSA